MGSPPVVAPPASVTLMVAPGFTVSLGEHLVSVEIGLLTLMLYLSGVSVTSPGAVSLILPFMSDSTMGLFFLIGGFCAAPSTARSAVCAPPTLTVPVGLTVSLSRSRTSGLFEAACVVFQTTSTSSPTFASAGARDLHLGRALHGGQAGDRGRDALGLVRDFGGLCRCGGEQEARTAQHQGDAGRAHSPLGAHVFPFVVGLLSDGAES